MNRNKHSAFTLVELLVVIAIVAILVLLLLPALNAVRESARRTRCMGQMSQLIMATHSYEDSHEHFPSGVKDPVGPIVSRSQGFHHGWAIELLPYLEENTIYRQIDQQVSVYHKRNAIARARHLGVLLCPSSDVEFFPASAPSSYAGVHHNVEAPIDDNNHGVFYRNSKTTRDDISDGTKYTLFYGETIEEPTGSLGRTLGWISGSRATLRNTGTPLNQTGANAQARMTLTDKQIEEFDPNEPDVEDFSSSYVDEKNNVDAQSEDTGLDVNEVDPSNNDERDDVVDASEEELDGDAEMDQRDSESDQEEAETAPDKNDPFAQQKKDGTYVGGFGSMHAGGGMFAFGDGRVKFISNSISTTVYQLMGHRADGKLMETSP